MKTIPEITDDEIRSYMDFDKLIEMSKSTSARSRGRSIWKTTLILLGVAVITIPTAWYLLIQNNAAQTNSTPPTMKPQPEVAQTLTDTATVHPESLSKEEPISRRAPSRTKSLSRTSSEVANSNRPQEDPAKDMLPSDRRDSTAAAPVASNLYKQAEPVDGYDALYEYFGRALSYPHDALKDSIEGVVVVAFTINPQGRPERITIEQSLGPAFDQESRRVISEMPDWRPATYNDKPVASRISVPLTFQISIKQND